MRVSVTVRMSVTLLRVVPTLADVADMVLVADVRLSERLLETGQGRDTCTTLSS
jgi:hypothetical protein